MDVLELITARRRTLADQLDSLTEPQWATQSLCTAWSVRDVVGHIVMPFTYSTPQVLFGIARARGNWHRFSEGAASKNAARPTADLVALLRAHAEDAWAPPGGGLIGALTDLTVHSLDIARPCGIDPDIDSTTAIAVLDNLVRPRSLKAFGLDLDGVRLEASDLDWSHGTGRPVTATAADLILAVTHRPGAQLEGDGVTALVRVS